MCEDESGTAIGAAPNKASKYSAQSSVGINEGSEGATRQKHDWLLVEVATNTE